MQLNGLANILNPTAGKNASAAATGANPAEGLLDSLQGGFESILADIQTVVGDTAEGLAEALTQVPEAIMEKISQLLGGMENLEEGTPLSDFLNKMGVDPQVLGLSPKDAKALVFDGDTFIGKGQTALKEFDLPAALEKLVSKVEALKENILPKNKEEVVRLFAEDLRSVRPGSERKLPSIENRRPSFFEGGDDFLKVREMAANAQKPTAQVAYSKAAPQEASMFSKYALENEMAQTTKANQLAAIAGDTSNVEQLILPEAITGVGKASGHVEGKTSTAQVFDMNSLGNVKSSEVINRIVTYLDQQQLTSKGNLDVLVKHDELGQFRLNVSRGVEKGAIEMRITAGNEGHRFFVDNEVELVKSLNQNGVRLSDLKILQGDLIAESGNSKSGSFNDSSSGEGRGQYNQSHQGRGGHSHDGAERRRQMWEEYRERMGAGA